MQAGPSSIPGRRGTAGVMVALAQLWAGFGAPAGSGSLVAQESAGLPSIEEKTDGMVHMEGFFDLHWDGAAGKLYLEMDRWNEEFLYQISLPTGLGSNPVGLDRGQLGGTHILEARRVGPRVLLVEPNYRYRALSDDAAERRAVEEAFAPSTHWGFAVAAETDERALVDATDFFLRDAHGVVRTLKRTGQGTFRLDGSRSVIHLPRTRAFERNTEVEVALTFTSDEPGSLVNQTAASGEAVTLRQHHSLVHLPDDGYQPRDADPRVGAFGVYFQDYATPIDQPVGQRWVSRHRLEKVDPAAERSEAVEPIVYYLDPGVPEPIRGALLDGARWWNQAFEAAGFIDAFQVRMLPEDADPMDLRYNMIHWTHRSTRGWSYGSTVTDPRTGEILKGNVNLGSLRLRQDHLIGVGLGFPLDASGAAGASPEHDAWGWREPAIRGSSAAGTGRFGACEAASGPSFSYLGRVAAIGEPVEMALARIRQLSAHEVGHTLGLAHNFIASTYGRASVMDYPAPTVKLTGGEIDLSDAYAVGIGTYDRFAIQWLYADPPDGADEAVVLNGLVERALADGVRFISDGDARPAGAAHPLAHLWDNGADPVATLRDEVAIRAAGLASFGPELLREGEPLSQLNGLLAPLYLHHRYQVEAALRSVGGADYAYAVQGDGQVPVAVVPAARQREALEAVLTTIDPAFLAISPELLEQIPPSAFAALPQERFDGSTGPTLDPLGIAGAAADFTVGLLLHPARVGRLIEFNARDPSRPGAAEVVDRVVEVSWRTASADPYHARVAEIVQSVVLDRLFEGATLASVSPPVRATFWAALNDLAVWLESREQATAHQAMAAAEIRRWQGRTHDAGEVAEPGELPPGSPIGASRGTGGVRNR